MHSSAAGYDPSTSAGHDSDLARLLALYRDLCARAGIEPLPDDEAREQARRFSDLLEPAFEREFRTH